MEAIKQKRPLPADPKIAQLNAAIKLAESPIKEATHVLQQRQDMTYSIEQSADRRLTAAQDLAWALINNPAFLFNH